MFTYILIANTSIPITFAIRSCTVTSIIWVNLLNIVKDVLTLSKWPSAARSGQASVLVSNLWLIRRIGQKQMHYWICLNNMVAFILHDLKLVIDRWSNFNLNVNQAETCKWLGSLTDHSQEMRKKRRKKKKRWRSFWWWLRIWQHWQ